MSLNGCVHHPAYMPRVPPNGAVGNRSSKGLREIVKQIIAKRRSI